MLPKNVWQYVVQIPRLASLGRKFVLQGGTQYNLAAVKAQVDYIKERVPGRRGLRAPAHRRSRRDRRRDGDAPRREAQRASRRFIGIDAAIALEYTTKNDEETVCHFCPNECKRTFIDTKRPDGSHEPLHLGLLLREGHRREQGGDARRSSPSARRSPQQFPNLVDYEAKRAFLHFYEPAPLPDDGHADQGRRGQEGLLRHHAASRSRARSSARARRVAREAPPHRASASRACSTSTRPRRSSATYFEALGIPKQNVVFSDATTEEMWVEGGKYGSIDPCFPIKVAQAHVHNLLFHQHTRTKKPLNYIFFPILTHVPNFVADTMDNACARSSPARPT